MVIPTHSLSSDSSELGECLLRYGVVLIAPTHSERELAAKLRELGKILLITPVKILDKPDAPTLYSYSRMRPHTDTPDADIIAWHCRTEGLTEEKTLLLDSHEILSTLSNGVIRALGEVRCEVPDRKNVPTKLHLAYENYPLLRRKSDGGLGLNYTPYLRFRCATQVQEEALAIFLDAIKAQEQEAMRIRLEQGQSLILDNLRFLHCRTDLDPTSPRCHYRYLISIGEHPGTVS